MTEAKVSAKLKDELIKLGAIAWKLSDRFHASRPDLLVIHNGRFSAIETKIRPNKPTALQKLTLDELSKAGTATYIASYHKQIKRLSLLHRENGHEINFKSFAEAAQWLLRPNS